MDDSNSILPEMSDERGSPSKFCLLAEIAHTVKQIMIESGAGSELDPAQILTLVRDDLISGTEELLRECGEEEISDIARFEIAQNCTVTAATKDRIYRIKVQINFEMVSEDIDDEQV